MRISSIVVVVGVFALVAGMAHGDSTPQAIRVQGYLSDQTGGTPIPVDGSHSMTFKLYDDELAGMLIATAGPMGVDVQAGYFEVELSFVASDFDGTQRFVQIIVEGESLTPRVRLVSAPFAYMAEYLDGAEAADLEESEEIVLGDAPLRADIDQLGIDFTDHVSGDEFPHEQYVQTSGDTMTGPLDFKNAQGSSRVFISHGLQGDGGAILLRNEERVTTITLDASSNDSGGGITIRNRQGNTGFQLTATDSAAALIMSNPTNNSSINLGTGTVDSSARISMRNAHGQEIVHINASDEDDLDASAKLSLFNRPLGGAPAFPSIELDAKGANGGADIHLKNSLGTGTVVIEGDSDDDNGGKIWIKNADGVNTIILDSTVDGGLLEVTGAVHAQEMVTAELVVKSDWWPDFVFEEDYALMPLDRLEEYIRSNGRLPEVPSSAQVQDHGVSVGESQARLLQKIEELTLHLIDQNRRLTALSAELDELRRTAVAANSTAAGR